MTGKQRLERLLRQYENCRITKEELRKYIESGALGLLRGNVGPFVCRVWNGRQIISDRALMYRKPMTKACIAERNTFSARMKFVKFLYSIDEIKSIWSRAETEGDYAWIRLIKQNNIRAAHPAAENIISPAKFHFANEVQCTINQDFSIDTHNWKSREGEKLILIMAAYEPLNSNDASFEIMRVSGGRLTEDQINVCAKYSKYIIYSAVIKSSKKVEWSNTAVSEGIIPVFSFRDNGERVLEWLLIVQRHIAARSAEYRRGGILQKAQLKYSFVPRL